MDQINDFSSLINLIKEAVTEEEFKLFAVKQYGDKFFCGRMLQESMEELIVMNNVDKNSICQDLYDCLMNEFGEQLLPGYFHSFDGSYDYFMTLGDNIMIRFPSGYEYRTWIYNQVQKDKEKQREEKSRVM